MNDYNVALIEMDWGNEILNLTCIKLAEGPADDNEFLYNVGTPSLGEKNLEFVINMHNYANVNFDDPFLHLSKSYLLNMIFN